MTKSSLHFTKMHGLGNDFAIINNLDSAIDVKAIPHVSMADRRVGIGYDQLLIIEPSRKADFYCLIYNADGSEAMQCGNGLRCIARYVVEKGLHNQNHLTIETKAGVFAIVIQDDEHIQVNMGRPKLQEKLVTFDLVKIDKEIKLSLVSMGNPHALIKMDKVHQSEIDEIAQAVRQHALFHEGINIGFMQIINSQHIQLRTYERGSGETDACGSNAAAAVVAGIANGWLTHKVQVEYKRGSLCVEMCDKGEVYLTGPATFVYSGVFVL